MPKGMPENEMLKRVVSPLGKQGAALGAKLSQTEYDELLKALAGFLVDVSKEGDEVTVNTEKLPASSDFKSVVYTGSGPKPNTMLVFSFKDAVSETMFPVIGLALTIYTGKWGLASIPTAAGILKTLWSKLIKLKRPDDANAIDVIQSLERVRTHHILQGANAHPTTKEITEDSNLPSDSVVSALKFLKGRGIIECRAWAKQTDDFVQPDNVWGIRL